LAFGVTGAPVIDAEGQVLGVVSLVDLAELDAKERVGAHMSAPAITTHAETEIEAAARALTSRNVHRLAVVDREGAICGVVSATDLLRGVLDLPSRHPSSFPGRDLDPAVAFGNEIRLSTEEIPDAPDGPGVFALFHHARGDAESLVWAEEASNVRTRLYELVAIPQTDKRLAALIEKDHQHLCFRAASVRHDELRHDVARRLGERVEKLAGLR
jgi:hypothetical protein